MVVGATAINVALSLFMAPVNLVMVYLLGVVWVAWRGHRGPATFVSILSVLAFDFLFVPPRFTLRVADYEYLFTFLVMLVVALIISELTSRTRQHEEERHQAKLKVETERLQNIILGSLPHDFRTPLATIMGAATSLSQRDVDLDLHTRRELAGDIYTEAERLNEMVNHILDLMKLESGALVPHKQSVPIEEIVGSALNQLEYRLNGRQIATHFPPTLPMISVDEQLMEQVLINLVDNALKYTPVDSPIEISAFEKQGSLVISVTDQGPGLPSEHVERLFEKFYRGSQKGREGVGLGLTICRAIVTLHGGHLTASNRPEGGASFRFSLPLPPYETSHAQKSLSSTISNTLRST